MCNAKVHIDAVVFKVALALFMINVEACPKLSAACRYIDNEKSKKSPVDFIATMLVVH